MTNFKEILRLHCGGFSQRSIATSLCCSRDTNAFCIKRAKERGLELPITQDVTHEGLRKLLLCHQEGIRAKAICSMFFSYCEGIREIPIG